MTARGMDFETALRRRRRLREQVVCSEPWVEAIVQPGDENDSWLYLPDVFPPGGTATAMRLCPDCERIAPPSTRPGPCCCDCRIEWEERSFGKLLLRRERRELLAELGRLWWRSAVPYADQPVAVVLHPGKKRAPPNRFFGAALSTDDAPMTEAEEGCPYDTRDLDGGGDDHGSPAGGISVAMEIARRRLGPPKKEDARAPGCQLVLLPESDTRLLAEIICYRKNGKVMPSTTRYSRHSPYMRAPEDWDTPTRLSQDFDLEATSIDAQDTVAWG